ncbi:hypothetical protein C3B47_13445 [Flavobacterium columnare]|nr:hypothetical protein [Flavobacterium columnare]
MTSLFYWTTSLFGWTASLFYSIKIKKDLYWQVFADKNDSQMLHVLKKWDVKKETVQKMHHPVMATKPRIYQLLIAGLLLSSE